MTHKAEVQKVKLLKITRRNRKRKTKKEQAITAGPRGGRGGGGSKADSGWQLLSMCNVLHSRGGRGAQSAAFVRLMKERVRYSEAPEREGERDREELELEPWHPQLKSGQCKSN